MFDQSDPLSPSLLTRTLATTTVPEHWMDANRPQIISQTHSFWQHPIIPLPPASVNILRKICYTIRVYTGGWCEVICDLGCDLDCYLLNREADSSVLCIEKQIKISSDWLVVDTVRSHWWSEWGGGGRAKEKRGSIITRLILATKHDSSFVVSPLVWQNRIRRWSRMPAMITPSNCNWSFYFAAF